VPSSCRRGRRRGRRPARVRVRIDAELAALNDAYEARFGFRYCVFVADRPRAALLPEMRSALAAGRDDELHRALDAVVDIAEARLAALQGS
jgi:2-oxo-4-hydroxy-4-carboxy-5-ureidoimidazoline decarboxylase